MVVGRSYRARGGAAKSRLVACAALAAGSGRQNSVDRLLQDAWAVLDAGGPELDPVRQALLLLTSYPAQSLGDDAAADSLIAGVRLWAGRPSPDNNDARCRSAAFIAAYQERLADLARLRVPCLVVGFELDADTFAARAREVATAIPGSSYVELPDAGHLAPVVDPQSVIDHVLAFFHRGRSRPRESDENYGQLTGYRLYVRNGGSGETIVDRSYRPEGDDERHASHADRSRRRRRPALLG